MKGKQKNAVASSIHKYSGVQGLAILGDKKKEKECCDSLLRAAPPAVP